MIIDVNDKLPYDYTLNKEEKPLSTITIKCGKALVFGKTVINSFEIAVDEKGKIDLSIPENAKFLRAPQYMREILMYQPEAYSSIPKSSFISENGRKRNFYLKYFKDSVLARLEGERGIEMLDEKASPIAKAEYEKKMESIISEKDAMLKEYLMKNELVVAKINPAETEKIQEGENALTLERQRTKYN